MWKLLSGLFLLGNGLCTIFYSTTINGLDSIGLSLLGLLLVAGGIFLIAIKSPPITLFRGKFRFLSNFFIDADGFCVEIHYQAAKCADDVERESILKETDPRVAKRRGKKVKLCADWEFNKITVMYSLLRRKFEFPLLRSMLLSTGDVELIEGNLWHDNFWGNCECIACSDIEGKNMLGKLLMQIRKELRA